MRCLILILLVVFTVSKSVQAKIDTHWILLLTETYVFDENKKHITNIIQESFNELEDKEKCHKKLKKYTEKFKKHPYINFKLGYLDKILLERLVAQVKDEKNKTFIQVECISIKIKRKLD